MDTLSLLKRDGNNIAPVTDLHFNHITQLQEAIEHFNRCLDAIEKKCGDDQATSEDILKEVVDTIFCMREASERFEEQCANDPALIKQARIDFRRRTDYFICKSYFLHHARLWPRGYPGDYKILEGLYKNVEMSSGIGFYLDRYFLSVITLAQAVKGRKEKLREILRLELEKRKSPKILNIACGSCRELFELAPHIKSSGAQILCIDKDDEALNFSSDRLYSAGLTGDMVKFRKYNAVKMINHAKNMVEFGQQDLIYSVGLFDYLTDEILIKLLNSLYSLLLPGGRLITSFKDARLYRTFDNKWLLDWDAFYQRTEEDMWNLFSKANISRSALETTREESGVIVFFIATK